MIVLAVEGDDGIGQELRKLPLDADRSAAEADRPMGGRESLVQVELAHIEADVAGADDAEQAVAVGLIVSAKAAGLVHEIDELANTRIEEAGVLWAGEHDAGRALRDRGLQGRQLGIATFARIEREDLEAGNGGRGRIGRVRESRRDDLVPPVKLAARLMIGTDDAGVGVDALSAAARLETELVHAGDLAHEAVHAVHDFEQALEGRNRPAMDAGRPSAEAGPYDH